MFLQDSFLSSFISGIIPGMNYALSIFLESLWELRKAERRTSTQENKKYFMLLQAINSTVKKSEKGMGLESKPAR